MSGRRNCGRCTRWRPVTDFRARRWWPGGRVRALAWECDSCHRQRERARYQGFTRAEKRKANEQSREAHAVARRRAGILEGAAWHMKDEAKDGDAVWSRPLLEIIERRGLTDKRLARMSGVSERVLGHVRMGCRISLASADKLCLTLDVSLFQLYGDGDGAEFATDEDLQRQAQKNARERAHKARRVARAANG